MKLSFPEGALRPIGGEQLDGVRRAAAGSPRRRAVARYHEHDELVQRMLNALEPGTYVRPHRHRGPSHIEAFLALAGAAWVVCFGDDGGVLEAAAIEAGGPTFGAEVPPGAWHTVVSRRPGTVLYEIQQGPYVAASHKDFAPWAPAEGSPAAAAWLDRLSALLAGA